MVMDKVVVRWVVAVFWIWSIPIGLIYLHIYQSTEYIYIYIYTYTACMYLPISMSVSTNIHNTYPLSAPPPSPPTYMHTYAPHQVTQSTYCTPYLPQPIRATSQLQRLNPQHLHSTQTSQSAHHSRHPRHHPDRFSIRLSKLRFPDASQGLTGSE